MENTAQRNRTYRILPLVLLLSLSLWLISPWGQSIEEGFGLDVLFWLRGPIPPPEDVAIIAITERTSEALQLPRLLTAWPRSVYADLVQTLNQSNTALMVFDIFFREPGDPESDRLFSHALHASGKGILFAYSERQIVELNGQKIQQDRILPPLELFSSSALSTAPFILPKVSSKLTRYWLRWEVSPPRLTLPGVAYRYTMLNSQPREGSETDRSSLDQLNSIQIYNFYGPPRSFPTISLEDFLSAPRQYQSLLDGAVVFIGYSASFQPDQKDGFYTPFTPDSGLDISGVELAATAYANLIEGSYIRHNILIWLVAFLLYIGLLFFVGMKLSAERGLILMTVAAGFYLAISHGLFTHFHFWLPWVTPVLIATPLIAIFCVRYRLLLVHQRAKALETVFGQYLPAREIQRLAASPDRLPAQETLFGVCMVTDATGFTSIAEKLTAGELSELLDDYYKAVISPIRRRGGMISDVAGDGIIALWPHVDQAHIWEQMKPVINELQESIDHFNRLHDSTPLPTRIGIHAGEVVLGHFGASDHFEYRAIGDIVNTTSRIENANKFLGQTLLLSGACAGPDTKDLRLIGHFLLSGKQTPLTLYTITGEGWKPQLERQFREALASFTAGNFTEAKALFAELLRETGDNACEFYRQACDTESPFITSITDAHYLISLPKET